MPKTKHNPIPMARIIRDCREGGKDYSLSLERAKLLFAEGKLDFDRTNNCYSHKTPMEPRYV